MEFEADGSRFPGGTPSIFSAIRRPVSPLLLTTPVSTTTASTSTIGSSERERETLATGNKRERYFGQVPSGFAASIPVPVYRRPTINHSTRDSLGRDESIGSSTHSDTVTYIKPQANIILSAEDIYKSSEVSESSNKLLDEGISSTINAVENSTSATSPVEIETMDATDEVMSTERSSSFSVSVSDDVKVGSSGSVNNEDERLGSVDSNDLQQVDGKSSKVNIVQATSVPVVTDAEPITTTLESLASTTTIPSPASTSTKIVKTVRVRQRMRSGSFNGPLRTRFHGPGRVRVVHRPANQEYIRHFPEFATHEGDKLAKEEVQEVKNALIELKKSVEKTH